MVDRVALLADLKKLLKLLQDDLRERCDQHEDLDAPVKAEWQSTREAGRTAEDYAIWREEWLTQVGAAWLLTAVFVRFMEDNDLIVPPRLSGPDDRRRIAQDNRTQYFNDSPTHSDRDYLLHVFETVAALPAADRLFDRRHNPLWRLGPSGDCATRVIDFWHRIDPGSGELVHDFTDLELDTRFLGDLYQDLSEEARKKYALLQTPEFVEEFILDRTLMPAIETFGYRQVRLIDPACGSGHFLLGAFHRLFEIARRHEPGTNPWELARRALDAVHGVDINPFAVAIARFRLLVAALRETGITGLSDVPAFPLNVYTGDSLLLGRRFGADRAINVSLYDDDTVRRALATEDAQALNRVLGQQYHVVVGNPPYITVDDKALNAAYRERFASCFRAYHLSVPFIERFFELAASETSAGFVGIISDNAFMKGQFGQRLVERLLPTWDVTHIIDTRFAHIPGHGTPTVILFGRNRKPTSATVRAVLGLRGETRAPSDPATAPAWTAIVGGVDVLGLTNRFISVVDLPRELLKVHPWSLGGGGATELKQALDSAASHVLGELIVDAGAVALTRDDDAFVIGDLEARRLNISPRFIRPYVAGEGVRDWAFTADVHAIWPYSEPTLKPHADAATLRLLWRFRTELSQRVAYGKSQLERGLEWYAYSMLFGQRFRSARQITFSNVNTHNHFALATGNVIFNAHAPVLIPSHELPNSDILKLLGVLNSSTSCFWIRQVFQPKGGGGIGRGISTEPWEVRVEIDTTKLKRLPLALGDTVELVSQLTELSQEEHANRPVTAFSGKVPTSGDLSNRNRERSLSISKMIALQEELDWECYRSYGLLVNPPRHPNPPPLQLGQRAFEIVLARQAATGEAETAWFERNSSKPIAEVPVHWPEDYKQIVRRRIEIIDGDRNIALIEQPEHKRRWSTQSWEVMQEEALRKWMLDRVEGWPPKQDETIGGRRNLIWDEQEPRLISVAQLVRHVRLDEEFMHVAALYRGSGDFDVNRLIADLVDDNAVPFLPVLVYKESGLRKREVWQRTWELQRQEDDIDDRTALPAENPECLSLDQASACKRELIGTIHVPPKYAPTDFRSTTFWRLRGKLDVPKERFISYPAASRDVDPSLVVAWAGWDHLQQARALAAYYFLVKEQDGWPVLRLTPLLAGLLELLPWLKQWHNGVDPETGERLGDYFDSFLEAQARSLGLTRAAIRGWKP